MTLLRWPPALRALLAQVLAFGLTLVLVRITPVHLPPLGWLGVDAVLAAGIGRALGLASWWTGLNLLLPWLMQGASALQLPGGLYLGALVALLLVFGGGLLIQVPLYHSNREAWRSVYLIPEARPSWTWAAVWGGSWAPRPAGQLAASDCGGRPHLAGSLAAPAHPR